MNTAYGPAIADRRRLAGVAVTGLVHVALLLGWHMAQQFPALQSRGAERATSIFWLPPTSTKPRMTEPEPKPREFTLRRLREMPPPVRIPVPASEPAPVSAPAAPDPGPALPAAPQATDAAAITAPQGAPAGDGLPGQPGPAATLGERILNDARRDIGKIDKALRKENRPYIAAPLDSPHMRMRRGMEQAAALAKPGLFEAPKVEELVNNTGDGARRSRVITGNGTYCVTERATNTSIDMIEKHGKLRITSCPKHETPATQQSWRTLQD